MLLGYAVGATLWVGGQPTYAAFVAAVATVGLLIVLGLRWRWRRGYP